MDAMFNQMQSEKKNNVENIVEWLKQAKIIKDGDYEKHVKDLFSGGNSDNVPLEQFKKILATIAAEQKEPIEQYFKSLTAEGAQYLKKGLLDGIRSLFKAGNRGGGGSTSVNPDTSSPKLESSKPQELIASPELSARSASIASAEPSDIPSAESSDIPSSGSIQSRGSASDE